MKGIDHQIYLLVITHEDMGWGEILSYFPKEEHRTVGRAIKRLVVNNVIEYSRIRGKGKWKRYFLKEEKTKNNLLLQAVKGNKKKWKHVRVPVTQKNLSKFISQEIQFYRKEESDDWKNVKDAESLHRYISYNIAIIIHCLKWISQLTWAMNSGMLGNSETKLAIANRNKERYEDLLSKVVYNLTAKDKGMMKAISKLIYNEIMDTMIFEESTIGGGKNREKRKKKMVLSV